MEPDYYKILGVDKKADTKAIKSAYRALARKHHPDVNPGNPAAEETFKRLGEAYEVLKDEAKRAVYDQELAGPNPRPSAERSAPGSTSRAAGTRSSADGMFTGMGGGKDAFSSMMDDLLGGGAGRRPASSGAGAGNATGGKREASRAASTAAEQTIDVSLEEAYHGANRHHTVSVDEACETCRGTGKAQSGRDGLNLGAACKECRGTGRKAHSEDVSVVIPAGIADGSKLRLRNKGAMRKDGQREDMLLTVRLKSHPTFDRDGSNLTFDLIVPYTVAALGGDITADVLGGKKTISVPRGSQCGQKMRLAGQGLPGLRERPAGDLFAKLKIVIPKDLNAREEALLRELAQARHDPVRT